MDGYVDGWRASVEGLADHEHGFAMRISASAEEGDIRGEGNVSGDLLPDEMEVVDAKPHILAAAGDGICVACAVIQDGAGVEYRADILVALEEAKLRRLCLQSNGCKRGCGEDCVPTNGEKRASRHKRPLKTLLRSCR